MISNNTVCKQCIHTMVCMTVWGPKQVLKKRNGFIDMDLVSISDTYFFECRVCEKNHVWVPRPPSVQHTIDDDGHKDYVVPDGCPRMTDDTDDQGTICIACYAVEYCSEEAL